MVVSCRTVDILRPRALRQAHRFRADGTRNRQSMSMAARRLGPKHLVLVIVERSKGSAAPSHTSRKMQGPPAAAPAPASGSQASPLPANLATEEDRVRAAAALEKLPDDLLQSFAPTITMLLKDRNFIVRRLAAAAQARLTAFQAPSAAVGPKTLPVTHETSEQAREEKSRQQENGSNPSELAHQEVKQQDDNDHSERAEGDQKEQPVSDDTLEQAEQKASEEVMYATPIWPGKLDEEPQQPEPEPPAPATNQSPPEDQLHSLSLFEQQQQVKPLSQKKPPADTAEQQLPPPTQQPPPQQPPPPPQQPPPPPRKLDAPWRPASSTSLFISYADWPRSKAPFSSYGAWAEPLPPSPPHVPPFKLPKAPGSKLQSQQRKKTKDCKKPATVVKPIASATRQATPPKQNATPQSPKSRATPPLNLSKLSAMSASSTMKKVLTNSNSATRPNAVTPKAKPADASSTLSLIRASLRSKQPPPTSAARSVPSDLREAENSNLEVSPELARNALALLALSNLAQTLVVQCKYDEAESLLRQAVEMSVDVLGPNHNDPLHAYANLAHFLATNRAGQHNEASRLFLRELEGSLQTRGREHPLTITCAGRLADVLIKHGQMDAAEPLLRENAVSTRAVYGPSHEETSLAALKLIKLLQEKGRVEEAERLAREEVKLCTKAHGSEHRRTKEVKTLLASLLRSQNKEVDTISLPKSTVTQGDLLLQAKAKRQAQRSPPCSPGKLPELVQTSPALLPSFAGPKAVAELSSEAESNAERVADASDSHDYTAQMADASRANEETSTNRCWPTPFDGFFRSFQKCVEPPKSNISKPELETYEEVSELLVTRVLDKTRTVEEIEEARKPPTFSAHSAICFAAGHLDVLSAVALACTDREANRVLSKWLASLKSAHVLTSEPASRLGAAAKAAAALPQLSELFVGDHRLDLRWLQSSDVQSKKVLDLSSATASARGNPLAAFHLCFLASRIASSKTCVRRIVPAKACEIDLLARKVDLKALELGDVATAALLGALAGGHTPNLREVILTSNKITDAAMDSFAAAIATGGLASLKVLALGENKIGPLGIARFVVSLVGREELTELSELPQLTELSEEAASAIQGHRKARLYATNQKNQHVGLMSLTRLVLDGNQLGDQGVASLAAPLACGALPMLEHLGLSRNNIKDPTPISRALETGESPMVRKILLQQNPLHNGATQMLHDAVGASTPKATPTLASTRGGQVDEGPTGVAVRVRRSFQLTGDPKTAYVPSHRRGLSPTGANQRDVGAQTRFVDDAPELKA